MAPQLKKLKVDILKKTLIEQNPLKISDDWQYLKQYVRQIRKKFYIKIIYR